MTAAEVQGGGGEGATGGGAVGVGKRATAVLDSALRDYEI
jgi:hypothetical protein|eukprot:COSAG01_NODE_10527_length_2140_cov_41.572268_2_plen_40_part_00